MTRFFSFEELRNATVIDSEGYVYGYVGNIELRDDRVELVVYVRYRVRDLAPDVPRLVSVLRSRGIDVDESTPLEVLVSLARREGVDVPIREVERDLELVKGFVGIDEVELIDVARIQRGSNIEELRVVLLSTPREARYRGIPIESTVARVSIRSILGKLVVSKSRGILGYAEEVVCAPKTVGVRVYRSKGCVGYINWINFLTTLKRMGRRELFEELAKFRDPYRFSRIELTLLNDVKKLIEDLGGGREVMELLERSVVVEQERREYVDVPLSKVLKVGDVVVVE